MAAIINSNSTDKLRPASVDLAWGEDYGSVRYLDDSEMIETYQLRKREHPHALITIDDHGSGWAVTVHESGPEKQAYYARKLLELWTDLIKRFADK